MSQAVVPAASPTPAAPTNLPETAVVSQQLDLARTSTGRSSNGGTEAINGLIELHRRVARGFRNRANYRLRMLLIGGGLARPHLK